MLFGILCSMNNSDYESSLVLSALDALRAGLLYVDDEGKVWKFSDTAKDIFGYSATEAIGMNIHDLISDFPFNQIFQDLETDETNTAEVKHYVNPQEYTLLCKDGSPLTVEVAVNLFEREKRNSLLCVVRDITEQSNIYQTLRKSAERFDLAMHGVNDGLWDWDLISNEVYFSPRWKSMLGYEESEIKNHLDEWAKNVHSDDLNNVMSEVTAYLENKTQEYRVEFRMRHKNGHFINVLSRGQVVRNKQGKAIRFVGTHVDITENKKNEKLLRESELKFRTLFDASSDAIMLLDETGFFDCNAATLKMFHCNSVSDFCEYHPADLSPALQESGCSSLEEANKQIEKVMREGSNFFEWTHRRINGEIFPAEVLLSTMLLDGKSIIEATVRDISERKESERMLKQGYDKLKKANHDLKEAQAQLLQSEKMASIGQLAAGVAHEINNPVGYVSSNISTLKKYVKDLFELLDGYESLFNAIPESEEKNNLLSFKNKIEPDYLRQDINDIIFESIEGVSRVKNIVQDLKDFSHVDQGEWEYADLHKGINSTLNIINNELKYRAAVVKEFGEIPPVYCMPSQINQVILNLLVNASHAIEKGGYIYIRTGVNDDWLWMEIEDTGKGIPEENIKRIFEPFFTTKDIGKGTGLGLSMTYGIIEKHNGRIDVSSKPGEGTVFRICLPRKPESTGQ